MGFFRRTIYSLFQWLPHVTLLLADASDFMIAPWLGMQAPSLMGLIFYFWLIYRPNLLYPSVLFAQSVMRDLLTGDPLGFSALLVGVSIVSASCVRPYLLNQPFLKGWLGSGVLLVSLLLFKQTFALVLFKQPLPFMPMVVSILFSMGVYPLVAMALNKLLFRFESIKNNVA